MKLISLSVVCLLFLVVIGCDKTIHEARLDRTNQKQSLASAQPR